MQREELMLRVLLICTGVLALAVGIARAAAPAGDEPVLSPRAAALEFKEPLVMNAIHLVETGRGEEAIEELRKALADLTVKSDERSRELNAGLGLVYLRMADFVNARSRFNSLSQRNDGTTIGARCRVLLVAADRASKQPPEYKDKLKQRETWLDNMAGVERDLWERFRRAHEMVRRAIDAETWRGVGTELPAACKLVDQIDVIYLPERDEGQDILVEHVRLLAAEVESIQRRAARHRSDGLALLSEINGLRAKSEQGRRASLVDKYNAHRRHIPKARDAARLLIDEYRDRFARNKSRLGKEDPLVAFTVPDLDEVRK